MDSLVSADSCEDLLAPAQNLYPREDTPGPFLHPCMATFGMQSHLCTPDPTLAWHAWPPFGGSVVLKSLSSFSHFFIFCCQNLIFKTPVFQIILILLWFSNNFSFFFSPSLRSRITKNPVFNKLVAFFLQANTFTNFL